MNVRKRNGTLEPVKLEKILKAVTRSAKGISDVDPARVAVKTIGGLFDGATTRELDKLSIETAASLIPEHANYSKLAAALLVEYIRKEVVSEGIESFSQSFLSLNRLGLVTDESTHHVQENARKLDNAIDDSKNTQFEYYGIRNVYDHHLLRNRETNAVLETPQQFFMRRAVTQYIFAKDAIVAYRDAAPSVFTVPTIETVAPVSADEPYFVRQLMPGMRAAYESGDVYMAFAIDAGAAPPGATKATHPEIRDLYKIVVLATQYGQTAVGLAKKLGKQTWQAQELLDLHRRIYSGYWTWSEWMSQSATFAKSIETVFGWPMHVTSRTKPNTVSNFPMQANGAEMLRWACTFATERGIEIHAPVQDALLVGGSIGEIDDVVAATENAMAEASRLVLDGFTLRTDKKIVRYPDRYVDERGVTMWNRVLKLLNELEAEAKKALTDTATESAA